MLDMNIKIYLFPIRSAQHLDVIKALFIHQLMHQ